MNAQLDYSDFLDEMGINEAFVRQCSEIESDRITLNVDGISVKASDIEGMGLFADKPFKDGDLIMPAVVIGHRTEAGRYLNHSPNPNAVMVANGDGVDLYAIRDISDEEITTNYRDTHKTVTQADTSKSLELVKGDIQALEDELLSMPQVDLPLIHHFAHGVYGREMRVPATVAFTGKVHKTNHLCVLAAGEMVLIASNGSEERMIAPRIFVMPANTKKAGYAVTDCVFMTIHGTHETDLDKIEKEFVSTEYEDN